MPLAQKKTVKQMQPSLSLIVSMTSEIMEMNKVGTDGEIYYLLNIWLYCKSSVQRLFVFAFIKESLFLVVDSTSA